MFVGFLLGGPVWGVSADKFGRKKVCAYCTVMCIVCVFVQVLLAVLVVAFLSGMASAFSPNYYVLLLFRGMVGFAIGGGFLGYVCEYIHI